MPNYLLDANHISPLVTVGEPLRKTILRRIQAGDQFFVPAIAFAEASFGYRLLPRSVRNQQEWLKFRPKFDFLEVSEADAIVATDLRLSLRSQGWQLALADAIIAAAAIRNNLILLTTDKDFQRVPNLKIENWRSQV